ncbi:hypothetical protein NW762_014114 [Fusarium torreyae]|uniref:FAD-binding domain-containing protein n=1 Tax=Fusarium torreyae TaxID=1237075 RepID=A0A9W8RMS5_9HYPO|nr:hypothetical protein NW762_014114 [Fusarium torreyae]
MAAVSTMNSPPSDTANDSKPAGEHSSIIQTDVLVVGAGVTGLTLSTLLSEYGVQTLTIAKHSGTAPSPRAHVTNQRTMELFRDMGIEDDVRKVAVPLPELGNGVIATTLTGLEIGRYGCYGGSDHQLSKFAMSSPCQMVNSPQHLLEPLLLGRAREMGADIRFNHELVEITQDADGVMAKISDRNTGARYSVSARYAVGADGGRSLIATTMGIKFDGQPGLMSMTSTWLKADLTAWTAYRPSCIYRLCKPGNDYWVGAGMLVNVYPWDEWVLNRQYDPAEGDPDLSDASLIENIRDILGLDESLPIEIKHVAKWEVNHVVATEYRRGRVFIAGDAAHRHPPASGLGSNTCIQDAYNLAWKLALVIKGQAEGRLLGSYEQERQPIGKQIVDHAIQTLYDMTALPKVLGFQRGQTREQGFASLQALFSDAPGAEQRRKELEEQVSVGNRRSNALGIHLGQRYKESVAVISDGTPFPPLRLDPILDYEPTTHPGAYLPHAWVECRKKRLSTLDVLEHGSFGLIVGIGGQPWETAAEQVSKETGVKLPVHKVGYRCPYDDVLGEWTSRREIGDRGVLLVRPDRFIAWRSHECPEDATAALRSAFMALLGREA